MCCFGVTRQQITTVAHKPHSKVIGGEKALLEVLSDREKKSFRWEADLGKIPSSLLKSWGFEEQEILPPRPIPTENLGELGARLLEQDSFFEIYDCGNKVWTYKR